MISPHVYLPRQRTREEIEASFTPCPICERVVEREVTLGVYRPFHDMEKHGLDVSRRERMETEDLMGIPRALP